MGECFYRAQAVSILEWAVTGAIMLGVLVFCFRAMRKGMRTLDDDRKQYLEKISAGERRLAEDRKNISALEHLDVAQAALSDLIRLEDNPPGFELRREGKKLELLTPQGSWQVELVMNERKLQSTRKVLHGRSSWILSGFGHFERHNDIGGLLCNLNGFLHSDSWEEKEPEHLARRLSSTRAIPRRKKALRHI